MKRQRTSVRVAACAAVLAAAAAPGARAIDLEAGDWKFSVKGNVNGSYIYSNCDNSVPDVPLVPDNVTGAYHLDGGLACSATTGSSSVSNGLLPAAITFNGSTYQNGYDLGFTFGFYPGISTNDGGSPNLQQGATLHNTGLGTTGLDIRQVFLTFGNDRMGTVLVGRNIGLFGADAILNDMTLQAVGAGDGNYAAPANTALGSIGLGYIYTDWLAQIDYTTPEYFGTKITVGVFDPLETFSQAVSTTKNMPGFHGKASYTYDGLYLSVSALFQKQRGIDVTDGGTPVGFGYSSWGFDVGGKYDAGPFEVLGWYYHGTGLGTTALFNLANDPVTGRPRDSDGFLAQITFQLGPTKFGFNYGQSRLERADGEPIFRRNTVTTADGLLLESGEILVSKNDKFTVGVYHSLTPNLTLTAEASYVESDFHAGEAIISRNFDVGAFLKF